MIKDRYSTVEFPASRWCCYPSCPWDFLPFELKHIPTLSVRVIIYTTTPPRSDGMLIPNTPHRSDDKPQHHPGAMVLPSQTLPIGVMTRHNTTQKWWCAQVPTSATTVSKRIASILPSLCCPLAASSRCGTRPSVEMFYRNRFVLDSCNFQKTCSLCVNRFNSEYARCPLDRRI